jgi:hypothetical protein
MKTFVRILASVPLLAIAGFCVFGFLASFEPGNGLPWKVGYGALGCGCMIGAIALLRRRADSSKLGPASKKVVTGRLLIAAISLFFLAVLLL